VFPDDAPPTAAIIAKVTDYRMRRERGIGRPPACNRRKEGVPGIIEGVETATVIDKTRKLPGRVPIKMVTTEATAGYKALT